MVGSQACVQVRFDKLARVKDHPPELEDIDVLRRELQAAVDQGQVKAARAMLSGLLDHIVVLDGTLQVRYRLGYRSVPPF